MMTALTSISKAGAHTVPLPRATDAIGSTLRDAFGATTLPADMAALLHRLDRGAGRC